MQFQLKKASEKRIFYQKQHREILLGRDQMPEKNFGGAKCVSFSNGKKPQK